MEKAKLKAHGSDNTNKCQDAVEEVISNKGDADSNNNKRNI